MMDSPRFDENTTWTKDSPRHTTDTTNSAIQTGNYTAVLSGLLQQLRLWLHGRNECPDHRDMVAERGSMTEI